MYVPESKYSFDPADTVAAAVEAAPSYLALNRVLTHRCLCFLSTPSNATIQSIAAQRQGPIPPVRELLELAAEQYSEVRVQQGQQALPTDLLVVGDTRYQFLLSE